MLLAIHLAIIRSYRRERSILINRRSKINLFDASVSLTQLHTFHEEFVILFSGANIGGWYDIIKLALTDKASSITSSVRSLVSRMCEIGTSLTGSTNNPTLSHDSAKDGGANDTSLSMTLFSATPFVSPLIIVLCGIVILAETNLKLLTKWRWIILCKQDLNISFHKFITNQENYCKYVRQHIKICQLLNRIVKKLK